MTKQPDDILTLNPYLTGGPFVSRNGFAFSQTDHDSVRSAAVLNIISAAFLEGHALLPDNVTPEERRAEFDNLMETSIAAIPAVNDILKKVAAPEPSSQPKGAMDL